MKFSERWLRDWVDPSVTTEELADQLTMAGLEVDSVAAVGGDFRGVVVGHVLEANAHPNAEKLRICRVDVGAESALTIVCGAANVHPGMRAPTAVVGAVLPDGKTVQAVSLRGVESAGMLCSARELNLGEGADGLLELPVDSPAGVDIRTLMGLEDCVIDIDLTPNRGDCLSVAGIAREVGVLNRLDVRVADSAPVPATIGDRFAVDIQAPEGCPRYVGRTIRGIDPQATTPLWMAERLRRSGVRVLGPLVDVTNYVMLELGQPMHAFDLRRLHDGIQVRFADAEETLTLLDGTELSLDAGVLLIADHRGPVALAGIMGGEHSGCDEQTRDVFLESAFFSPTAIAGKARAFRLQTESAHRFERGVDPELQVRAMERATRLLIDIAGGEPGPIVEATSQPHLPVRPEVALRRSQLARLLGAEIDPEQVGEMLQRLGMTVESTAAGWRAIPPSFRFDIAIEADLIEEVVRIYGYNNIPSNCPFARLDVGKGSEATLNLARMRELMVDRGYQEAITYSFVEPTLQQRLNPEHQSIPLSNPISSELSVMRTSLWAGLIEALRHNLSRQQSRIRLFETGLVFRHSGDEIVQEQRIGALLCGSALPEQWGASDRKADYYDIKGDLEALLGLTGRLSEFCFEPGGHAALHPGRSARIHFMGRDVGWIGALHPAIERDLDLGTAAYLFELQLEAAQMGSVPAFRQLSPFPTIRRDLALVVDDEVPAQALKESVQSVGVDWLRHLHVFDVYRGAGIESGQKSMAIGLILQADSRTLTDAEVDAAMARIVARLSEDHGARLRD